MFQWFADTHSVFVSNAWFFYAVVGVFSLVIGSFLNVLIHRLPLMIDAESSHQPPPPAFAGLTQRSACPACHAPIPWRYNVPLFGWLYLRGRCAECRTPISPRYPLVELATLVLGLAAAVHFGPSLKCLFALLLVYALITLTVIDLETQYLPDDITLTFVWVGLVAALIGSGTFVALQDAVLGAIAGYMAPWILARGYRYARGVDGLGGGDMKMLSMLGAWFGIQALMPVVSMVVATSLAAGVVYWLIRRTSAPYPVGPYLAVAGMLYLFFGDFLGFNRFFAPL